MPCLIYFKRNDDKKYQELKAKFARLVCSYFFAGRRADKLIPISANIIKNEKSLDDYIKESFNENQANIKANIMADDLYSTIPKRKMARLTLLFLEVYFSDNTFTSINVNNLSLDHLSPSSKGKNRTLIDSIGNLSLMDKNKNSRFSNKILIQDKLYSYKNSGFSYAPHSLNNFSSLQSTDFNDESIEKRRDRIITDLLNYLTI